MSTGRESDKFMLRLPDGMRERIKLAAESNNRSMNAEIVATLEEKYPATFSRAEILKMMRASLFMFNARRRGIPPVMIQQNNFFLQWVTKYVLNEADVDGFIEKLGDESTSPPQVTVEEYIKWQTAMLARYQAITGT